MHWSSVPILGFGHVYSRWSSKTLSWKVTTTKILGKSVKLTIETPKRRHWPCFGVFTLNHEQANVCWGRLFFVSKHSKMLFLSKYKDSRMFQLLILLPWTGFYTMRYVGIHNNRILVNNKVQKQTQYKNSTTAVQKSPKTFLCG